MATKPQSGATSSPSSSASPTSNVRPAADVRDAVAELAERAQIISSEAGTKVAAAMRDVVNSTAGMAGFALESARDLVQYLVRRGQMTAEEGERLMREAEHAHAKRAGKKGGSAARHAGAKSGAKPAKPTSKHTKAAKAKAKKR